MPFGVISDPNSKTSFHFLIQPRNLKMTPFLVRPTLDLEAKTSIRQAMTTGNFGPRFHKMNPLFYTFYVFMDHKQTSSVISNENFSSFGVKSPKNFMYPDW